MPWDFFVEEFRAKYVTDMYKEVKWKQFLNLKQRNMLVAEYEKEFSHLSKYVPKVVLIEAFRCRQFEDGLNESIKRFLAPVTSLQHVNFYQLVQAAMNVEKSEMSNWERNLKRKFARRGSSSGKRIIKSQAESMYSSTARGRRQRPIVAPSFDRGISTGQGEISECPHCYKRHSGICIWFIGGCFRCGSTNQLLENCPIESGEFRNPQGSGRGGSNAPLTTHD